MLGRVEVCSDGGLQYIWAQEAAAFGPEKIFGLTWGAFEQAWFKL